MTDIEPSTTARRVAAYRLGFERLAAPFGDPAADQRLAADVAGSSAFDPNETMTRYVRARTAVFDRAVVNALERDVIQVAVIGAGYDGRSLRYAKPGVRWFEVDRVATLADKQQRLARLGIATPHVNFLGHDLTQPGLSARLVAAGWDPDEHLRSVGAYSKVVTGDPWPTSSVSISARVAALGSTSWGIGGGGAVLRLCSSVQARYRTRSSSYAVGMPARRRYGWKAAVELRHRRQELKFDLIPTGRAGGGQPVVHRTKGSVVRIREKYSLRSSGRDRRWRHRGLSGKSWKSAKVPNAVELLCGSRSRFDVPSGEGRCQRFSIAQRY